MAAMLIKALTALVVLIAVPIALAELCIIVVGLWTLFHWPKGGWKDDQNRKHRSDGMGARQRLNHKLDE